MSLCCLGCLCSCLVSYLIQNEFIVCGVMLQFMVSTHPGVTGAPAAAAVAGGSAREPELVTDLPQRMEDEIVSAPVLSTPVV